MRRLLAIVTGLIALIGVSGMTATTANAAPPVGLGGGAGIVIADNAVCTLTTIGYDGAGRLVGLTAGHCGGSGSTVKAEKAMGSGVLGVIRQSNRTWDYAVIEFDKSKVTPQRNYRGLTISGPGPRPAFGQTACKAGRTTGTTCGIVWGNDPQVPTFTLSQVCSNHGDSGAPIVVGDKVVGLLNGGRIIQNLGGTGLDIDVPCTDPNFPIHNPTISTPMTSIVADLNGRSTVGSGFRAV
jgi:hypothetical protein